MKKYAFWVSVGSLILFSFGFFVKNAVQIPGVAWVLCHRYVAAKAALQTLVFNGSLKDGDAGFSQLSSIVMGNITTSNMLVTPTVQAFHFQAGIGFAEHGQVQTSGQVTMDFSTGQTLTCQEKFLEDMVQKVFDSRVLFWSSVFFVLGLADGIYGLYLKYPAPEKPVAEDIKEDVAVDNDGEQEETDCESP